MFEYERRIDLEGQDKHLVIVNLIGEKKMRIINLYRTFNPQDESTQRGFFLDQLRLIRLAFTKDTITVGDFNLDYSKRYDISYRNHGMFSDFDEILGDLDVIQMVHFETLSRIINNIFNKKKFHPKRP